MWVVHSPVDDGTLWRPCSDTLGTTNSVTYYYGVRVLYNLILYIRTEVYSVLLRKFVQPPLRLQSRMTSAAYCVQITISGTVYAATPVA